MAGSGTTEGDMNWLLLALGALSAALAINAYRPIRWPAAAGLVSFFAGWLVGDLPVEAAGDEIGASDLAFRRALVGEPGFPQPLAIDVVGAGGNRAQHLGERQDQ